MDTPFLVSRGIEGHVVLLSENLLPHRSVLSSSLY